MASTRAKERWVSSSCTSSRIICIAVSNYAVGMVAVFVCLLADSSGDLMLQLPIVPVNDRSKEFRERASLPSFAE
eukprot:1970895-Prymnesium_polylepis.1